MSDHTLTRRRLATVAAGALAVSLAGCADDDVEDPDDPGDGPGNGGAGNGEGDDPVEEDDEEV